MPKTVSSHTLLPNRPDQTIDIFVGGGHAVSGVNFYAQVGDGGPELVDFGLPAGVDGPTITSAELKTGTIFAAVADEQFDSPGIPQVNISSLGISAQGITVSANGLLATLVIDTTGFFSGNWDLQLVDVLAGVTNGPFHTDLIDVALDVTNGTITIDASPSVVGRHVFYNNSLLDGQDPAASAEDDNAIAVDKSVLLPEQTISPANVIGSVQGFNGLMIDISNLADGENLDATDFIVRVGTGGDPDDWVIQNNIDDVSVRTGAGVGGSDRVTLIWPDETLTNTYLQLTVLANGRTGLTENDLFYVASQVGDATGDRKVNAADLAHVLAGWGTGTLPKQGNFDIVGTTAADDLATLFGDGGGPLADFTAPPVVAPDAARAVDAVFVQAIGPDPETDAIIGPIEFPLANTPAQTGRRLLRRIDRSFSDDAQPIDRQRLARQQAVDRIHEGELLEMDAKLRRARRQR